MTRFIRRARGAAFALVLLGSVASFPRVAAAQNAGSAADLESARELIVKGRELRDKGDLPAALEKFRSAHALAHTPVTGIELARTHVALKQPLEARDVCLGIGRMPVTREETARSREARDEANKIADEMKNKIATLSVKVTAPKDRTVTVKVDGVEVPSAALESRKVNPGKHVVTARVDDGPESTLTAEVAEGETRGVALEPKVPAVVKHVDGPGIFSKPDEYVEEKHMSPLVPVGFVVAGVGAVVGSVTGIVAISKNSTIECTECSGVAGDKLSTAKMFADVSTVSFAIAGVGAAVGIVGLLTPSTVRVRRGSLTVTPYVAGTGAGLHGTF